MIYENDSLLSPSENNNKEGTVSPVKPPPLSQMTPNYKSNIVEGSAVKKVSDIE